MSNILDLFSDWPKTVQILANLKFSTAFVTVYAYIFLLSRALMNNRTKRVLRALAKSYRRQMRLFRIRKNRTYEISFENEMLTCTYMWRCNLLYDFLNWQDYLWETHVPRRNIKWCKSFPLFYKLSPREVCNMIRDK